MNFLDITPGTLTKLIEEKDRKLLPKILPANEILKLGDMNRQLLMTMLGLYVWPTVELYEFFNKNIQNQTTVLELGAGNGVLGKKLGWNSTDNFSQSDKFNPRNEKEKINHEIALMQLRTHNIAPVNYGDNVINIDAYDAVRKYNANTAVGLYITDVTQNEFTINLLDVFMNDNTETFYLVGNMETHYKKSPIFELKHEVIEIEGLVVRHQNNGLGRIFKWVKSDLNIKR